MPVKAALLALALTIAAAAPAAQEMSRAEVERSLKELEAEISRHRESLESAQGEKSGIERSLKTNEKKISDLINRIAATERELESGEDKVARLRQEESALKAAKAEQQLYIRQQVRAAYKIGNQERLKLLLSLESPDEISRMLAYHNYIAEARAERIKRYNSTLVELDGVTRALSLENSRLAENRNGLEARRKALAEAREGKEHALQALTQAIAATGDRIRKLGADRKRLESILERIERKLATLPIKPDAAEPFRAMRGKLLMPVAGKVAHGFGHSRGDGNLKWNGVFIPAPQGEAVHAVHHGRVVFADWLRGFGLLTIISHGDGYMSLYGHNQALYRQTGDWVAAGDMIATVGDTGGQSRSGLYFEIRVAGKPTDPQKWCRNRQGHRQKRAA